MEIIRKERDISFFNEVKDCLNRNEKIHETFATFKKFKLGSSVRIEFMNASLICEVKIVAQLMSGKYHNTCEIKEVIPKNECKGIECNNCDKFEKKIITDSLGNNFNIDIYWCSGLISNYK